MHIEVSSPIRETPRVLQVRGLFDLPATKASTIAWDVELPLAEKPWHIGLIVGPSGSGKTTIARRLWPDAPRREVVWPEDQSIVDAFPAALSIKDIVDLLSSVGFASPPAWLRPFHVLSTGQQFRVTLARRLAETLASGDRTQPIVFDEYTSVVDRTVAQLGSAALAKSVRSRGARFVAVTCHEDVEAWLQPDWVYRPAEGQFVWRLLQRRPSLDLYVVRCRASAWPLFAPHHYLSTKLAAGAVCFLATWRERSVAFSAWLPFFGCKTPTRREHRTVTLPDYQGVGVGNALSATIAAMWRALGCRATSTTTHPALIRARLRSGRWRMTRAPALAGGVDRVRHAVARLTAGFEYVGAPLPTLQARALYSK